MIPHSFLLAPKVRIRRIWNGYYYRGRPSMGELYAELRDLTRDIRPDWDLSRADLKNQWDAGDKHAFYPYGHKSMDEMMKEMAGAVDQYAGAAKH
jgi:hypothetical protein